jgi:hypothetical protein
MIRALIIGIFSAGALGACASTPSHTAVRTASAIPPGWCSTTGGKAVRPGASGCDSMTRTFSGKQLRETGMTNAALALQMLDPSVTAVGH